MTKEQFNEIETKLAKWREDRGLRVEDQKLNFRVDYTEKLLRYFKAERDENELAMIDALCDMIVVAINAGVFKRDIDLKISNNFFSFGLEYSLNTIFCTFDILGYDPYKCLLENIKEYEARINSFKKWYKADYSKCKLED